MKILKLLGIAVVLTGVVVLVVYLTNIKRHATDPNHDNNYKQITEDIDAQWGDREGWSSSLFSDCLDDIAAKSNNGYITSEEKALADDYLYNIAIKKTSAALNGLYAESACKKSEVDAEYEGIKKISENAQYAADSEVMRQKGIYAEYTAALNFLSSGVASSPGFRFPSSWNSFDAGASDYRQKAANIKGNQYWDVISGIGAISNGLSQTSIDNKVSAARNAFALNLRKQIMSAYGNPSEDHIQNLRNVVDKYYNEFPSQRGTLSGFLDSYIDRALE